MESIVTTYIRMQLTLLKAYLFQYDYSNVQYHYSNAQYLSLFRCQTKTVNHLSKSVKTMSNTWLSVAHICYISCIGHHRQAPLLLAICNFLGNYMFSSSPMFSEQCDTHAGVNIPSKKMSAAKPAVRNTNSGMWKLWNCVHYPLCHLCYDTATMHS